MLDTRAGSGRRGGSGRSCPRHDRNLAYVIGAPPATCPATARAARHDPSASDVRSTIASAPSARCTSTTTVPGAAPSAASDSSVDASTSNGCAVPLWPTLDAKIVNDDPVAQRQLLRQARHGAGRASR